MSFSLWWLFSVTFCFEEPTGRCEPRERDALLDFPDAMFYEARSPREVGADVSFALSLFAEKSGLRDPDSAAEAFRLFGVRCLVKSFPKTLFVMSGELLRIYSDDFFFWSLNLLIFSSCYILAIPVQITTLFLKTYK